MPNSEIAELVRILAERTAAAEYDDTRLLNDEQATKEAQRVMELLRLEPIWPEEVRSVLISYWWKRFELSSNGLELESLQNAITLLSQTPDNMRDAYLHQLRLLLEISSSSEDAITGWYESAAAIADSTSRINSPESISRAVDLFTVVYKATREDSQMHTAAATALSNTHQRLYSIAGQVIHLNESIRFGKAACRHLPDGMSRAILLANLALAFRTRYQLLNELLDLDEAVHASRQALLGLSKNAVVHSGLAIALRMRFERIGNAEDLDDAIQYGQAAEALVEGDDPERTVILTNVAELLVARWQRTYSRLDIDGAIDAAKRAVGVPDGINMNLARITLCRCLRARYTEIGSRDDLQDWERSARTLIELEQTAEGRINSRLHLADALATRLRIGGSLADLNELVDLYRNLAADAIQTSQRYDYEERLASVLQVRAQATGQTSDLVEAIDLFASYLGPRSSIRSPKLVRIRDTLNRYGSDQDPNLLLDPASIDDTRSIIDLDAAPPDLESLCLAGWLIWLRADLRDDQTAANADLAYAAEVLLPVYKVHPGAVPPSLAEILAPAEASASAEVQKENDGASATAMMLFAQYKESADLGHLGQAIDILRGVASSSAESSASIRAAALNNLAIALMELAQRTQDNESLEEPAALMQSSIDISSIDDPYLPGRLSALCGLLRAMAVDADDVSLANRAIQVGRSSVQITPMNHPSRGMHLVNLGMAEFEAQMTIKPSAPNLGKMQAAILRIRAGHELLPPDHPHHVSGGQCLSDSIFRAYHVTDDLDSLLESIKIRREMLPLLRGRELREQFSALAAQSYAAFKRSPENANLEDAVNFAREALTATSQDDPQLHRTTTAYARYAALVWMETRDIVLRDELLGVLDIHQQSLLRAETTGASQQTLRGFLLQDKAETDNDPKFLAQACEAHCAALHLAEPGNELEATLSYNFVQALFLLYDRTGRLDILDQAIEVAQRALPGGTSAGKWADVLRLLVSGLQSWYEQTGDGKALEDAIHLVQIECERDPGSDSRYPSLLISLRFMRARDVGNQAQMNDCIRAGREELAGLAVDDSKRLQAINYLCLMLTVSYEYSGILGLLEEAVQLGRESVKMDKSAFALHNTLSLSLWRMYGRKRNEEYLAEAISVTRDLVERSPSDYPYRSLYLANLGGYLQEFGNQKRDRSLLDEAADVSRAAVIRAQTRGAYTSDHLASLASILKDTFEVAGELSYLDDALEAARDSIARGSDSDTHRGIHLLNLSAILMLHHDTTGQVAYLREAREVASRAATGEASTFRARIQASRNVGAAALQLGEPAEAMRAYQYALDLASESSGRNLERPDRENALRGTTGLPGEAAAAAISAGEPAVAVALLEQGRGVILAEALHSRMDLSALAAAVPALAQSFRLINQDLAALDQVYKKGANFELLLDATVDAPTPAWVAERRNELGVEWRALVNEIRQVPGFSDFLQSPNLTELQTATKGGFAVVINTSPWRCDALIASPAGIDIVPLYDLTSSTALEKVNSYLAEVEAYETTYRTLLEVRADIEKNGMRPGSAQSYHAGKVALLLARRNMELSLGGTLEWMWDVIVEPVLCKIGEILGASPPGDLRLWWCPTGPLTLLPIHAAGRSDKTDCSLLDRSTSSYIPTLRALVAARQAQHSTAGSDTVKNMLVVAMSETPGQSALPNAAREADLLRSVFPGHRTTLLSNSEATKAAVLAALPTHTWCHFSCHGTQDMNEPSSGGILLADSMLTVREVVSDYVGEFAFLSACKTAANGVALLDEAVTLASALHYSGYRHVVATLWSVYDVVAADVSEMVYSRLFDGIDFRPDQTAAAVRDAARELRRRFPSEPSIWTPFVHIGP